VQGLVRFQADWGRFGKCWVGGFGDVDVEMKLEMTGKVMT